MTKSPLPLEVENRTLKTRIAALEETHAFIAMYYTLRVAERLHEWRKTDEELGDQESARAMHLAYVRVKEMAEEFHAKSHVGIGDIT
jgi:hypothetical protein